MVVGTLCDTRPWAEDGRAVATVHDMELRVEVRVDDLTITGASAEMQTFPHTECPGITAAFAGLVGLWVTRGYTREVQTRFGGPKGCTHLEQLAGRSGRWWSRRSRRVGRRPVSPASPRTCCPVPGAPGPATPATSGPRVGSPIRSWPPGGRPGVGPYPSPAARDVPDRAAQP